jgi:hypothetical protein
MQNQDTKKEQVRDPKLDSDDDDIPTVLFCPKCEGTEITFIRCTALCLNPNCNYNWAPP